MTQVKNHKDKIIWILLGVILLGAFIVRLYKFDNPVADWHSWRQADTSAVSRNFVQHGYDILHPRFDDLSNIPSGKENPQGYRFVEFPIYNLTQAVLFQSIGIFTLEEWGRLVTIFASVFATLFLYLLVSRHSNRYLGLLSAFYYAFIPYNIFYGRTILPDPSMVTAILGGIYFFDRWLEYIHSKNVYNEKAILWYFCAVVFTASAFLLKPYALFFTLPMLYLAWQRYGWRLILQWPLWMFAFITIIPLAAWRTWIAQFPEGIPANAWLLNGNGIRFRPSFFRWMLYERITVLISGYLGLLILLFGVFKVRKLREWPFFASFLVSSILYVVIFATGNVQHDYYQILIMPSLAIFFAIGSYYLFKWSWIGKIILFVSLGSLFWFGWYAVSGYFNINNIAIVNAGKAVDKLTPKDSLVIANLTGDTSFLYQTNRKGWPSFEKPVPELIKMGADYLILVHPSPQDLEFKKQYKIVSVTKEYVIFDLHQK